MPCSLLPHFFRGGKEVVSNHFLPAFSLEPIPIRLLFPLFHQNNSCQSHVVMLHYAGCRHLDPSHPPHTLSLGLIYKQVLSALPPVHTLNMTASSHLTSAHLAQATATSCLDCCKGFQMCLPASALLSALSDGVLNPTTRIVLLKSKLHHVTSPLKALQKLPITLE